MKLSDLESLQQFEATRGEAALAAAVRQNLKSAAPQAAVAYQGFFMRTRSRWTALTRVWDYLLSDNPRPKSRPLGVEVLEAREVPATISGTVYAEVNGTSGFNSGDYGVPGDQVWLHKLTNNGLVLVATTTSGADGAYQFNGIDPSTALSGVFVVELHDITGATLYYSTGTVIAPGSPGTTGLNLPDQRPRVSVAKIADATEGGSAGTFRFTRTGSTSVAQTVNVSLSGTATAGTDYAAPTTVTFAAGSATADYTLTATNDSTSEPTETVVIAVAPGTGYAAGAPSAAMNIFDNDASVVSVATVNNAVESGAAGTVRFTRTGDLSGSLTVNYTVGGTATSGTDYTALSGTVTFSAGALTLDVAVAAYADAEPEAVETVAVSLLGGTNYFVGVASTATVNFADNPAPAPALLVTTNQDIVNPADGQTSLREAIEYVNQNGGEYPMRITFRSTLSNDTFLLTSQLPAITKNILLDGLGRTQTISRDVSMGKFGLFVVSASGSLDIGHLTVSNGWANAQLAGGAGGGGAILAAGDLTVRDCVFSDNRVSEDIVFGRGGAIWATGRFDDNGKPKAELRITNSVFLRNSAPYGGAVATDDGVINSEMMSSRFEDNVAKFSGGGLYLVGDSTVAALSHIGACIISGNSAGTRGGGIYSEDLVLFLEDATLIEANTAAKGGGVCVVGHKANNITVGQINYYGVTITSNFASDPMGGSGVYRDNANSDIQPNPGGVTFGGNPVNTEVVAPIP